MRSRTRKVNVALAVCALFAGFCATFGLITVLRPGDHASANQDGPKGVIFPTASRAPGRTADGQPSPSALDKVWLNYSDHSTCADWAGGDGVSAIKLSSSQTAWFFADTYLGPAGPTIGFSRLSGFLHNSVVMQTTTGHTTRLVTLTGGGACANPEDPGDPAGASSVVEPPGSVSGDLRYWDADGIRLGDTVVKFYNGYHAGQIPYIPVGTTMASFPVATLSAAGLGPAYGGALHPHLTALPVYTPPGGGTPIVWGSALLAVGSTVYIYGWQSPDPSSPVRELYLARVTAGLLTDFGAWQFYGGDQWVGSQSGAAAIEPTNQGLNVPSGFSVVKIAGRYWLIQAVGAGDPNIEAYPAQTPWGPFDWSAGILLYKAPGIGLNRANDFRIMYEARAEPALSTGRTLVISYNVNSEAVTAACTSMSHYTNAMSQPRFITVPKSVFSGSDPPAQAVGTGAAPHYPKITQQDPKAWFSAWSFPGGCPPVPGMSGLTGQASGGTVRLSWNAVGLGLHYRILERNSSGNYVRIRTTQASQVSLTGLARGQTYHFEVVPANFYQNTGSASFVTVQNS
jgi:hypothetical protein